MSYNSYAPVPLQAQPDSLTNSTSTSNTSSWLIKFLRGVALSATVAIVLVLTYHQCIWCVLAIAVFSALTMNCIPLMPLVFLMSLFVLMFHAIDYQRASIRLEVPLQDIVYVPSWDDFAKYVKVAPLQT
jgi:fatty acid desaturase